MSWHPGVQLLLFSIGMYMGKGWGEGKGHFENGRKGIRAVLTKKWMVLFGWV